MGMEKLLIVIFTAGLFSCNDSNEKHKYYCFDLHLMDGSKKYEQIYAPVDVKFSVRTIRGSYELCWERINKEWFITNYDVVKAAVIDFEQVNCK